MAATRTEGVTIMRVTERPASQALVCETCFWSLPHVLNTPARTNRKRLAREHARATGHVVHVHTVQETIYEGE